MRPSNIRLVAFDLDGTLTRGRTVCEALAERFGFAERMREIEAMRDLEEIRAARHEMLAWYGSTPHDTLCDELPGVQIAPGAAQAIAELARAGVHTAIVSINWTFAVEAFAKRLGVPAWIGTHAHENATIDHFWPADKPLWLEKHAASLGIALANVAAIGDSHGDVPMLAAVGSPVYVGATLPSATAHAAHMPAADIRDVVRWLLAR